MVGQPIDGIVESLVSGALDIDDFMRAVQKQIEDDEMESGGPRRLWGSGDPAMADRTEMRSVLPHCQFCRAV
jgi:hypothetical protein